MEQKTFVKGLVTEANKLAFPDNYFDVGDNIELRPNGQVRRRLAVGPEENFNYSTSVDSATSLNYRFQTFDWSNPVGDNSIQFKVVRFGPILRFYDVTSSPATEKSFSIDITSAAVGGATAAQIAEGYISTSTDNKTLHVAGKYIDPMYVLYDADTDNVSTEAITIQVRDFEDADPSIENDEELTSLTPAQEYDLVNRGWSEPGSGGTDPKDTYFTSYSVYPPKSKAPWQGKDSSNVFTSSYIRNLFAGNGSAARGTFTLDFFAKDRESVSGISGLGTETIDTRPQEVAFYAGRAWWFFENRCFFNQVLNSNKDIGKCFQSNDPTSEEISDLLDSDGGEFIIQEADVIRRARKLGQYLIVFADNGVWAIGGEDNIFKATAYYVNRLSVEGISAPESLIEFQGGLAYWSDSGINVVTIDQVSQAPSVQNISTQPIETYYNNIPEHAKQSCKGVYDQYQKELVWFYNKDTSVDTTRHQYYNAVLKFKLVQQAFMPYSINDNADYPLLIDATNTGEIVTVDDFNTDMYLLTLTEDGSDVRFTWGHFNDTSFRDFKKFGVAGNSYDSYVEPGDQTYGDAATKKQTPYVLCYFERTEKNFVLNGSEYVFDNPSSCFLQGKWSFSDTATSNRWTDSQQVYRLGRNYVVDPDDLTFDYGYDIITTKTKIKGRGQSLRMRFSSEEGKDFRLNGWGQLVVQDSNI